MKRNNAVGVKGKSGRKSLREEAIVARVLDMCWERIETNLLQNRLTDEQKDAIALELVKKSTPQKIDHTTKGDKIYDTEQLKAIASRTLSTCETTLAPASD